ncbi:hypothetical protein WH95_03220 [Kiloniella litopenaei]|uniref:DUF1127 domain-containing protein n=1 Tax=Kiloniella litopenaei TaxID=1549748 RepID=A0A0M2R906_9PROT|nr:hypothetical protein [Kiloniella litopenaei]KKJ78327.1 hypothetical protein WH95_03220 [Kiloniella litopenaei]
MLKQPCHTLNACHTVGTNGACGASFSRDHKIFASSTKEATTFFSRVLGLIIKAFEIREERRTLAGLSLEQREDIGVNTEQVHQESLRAYWDLPANRLS